MKILNFNPSRLPDISQREMFVDSMGFVTWRVVPPDAHEKELNPELWRFDVVSKVRPDLLKPVSCDLLAPNVSPDFFDEVANKFSEDTTNVE